LLGNSKLSCEKGGALIIRHVLKVQVEEDDINQKRKNIFHTCCHVQNKMIDSGSCVNLTSTTLVSKLNLCIIKHHKPYRL
jgi:hypothetical protein